MLGFDIHVLIVCTVVQLSFAYTICIRSLRKTLKVLSVFINVVLTCTCTLIDRKHLKLLYTEYYSLFTFTLSLHYIQQNSHNCIERQLTVTKGHSCSPCPQKNAHNFSLKWPTIFLPVSDFHIIILPVLFCVCQISIHCFIIELQYNIIILTLWH